MKRYLVPHNELKKLVKNIFIGCDIHEQEADMQADMLVNANLRGTDSHGVMRVGNYVDRALAGGMKSNASCSIENETLTTAIVNGNYGLGSVGCSYSAELARKKAIDSNVSFVVLKNTNHTGANALWSLKIAQDDMVGIVGTAAQPNMAATGSIVNIVGNNPFSIAIPSGKYPHICLDVACSIVAGGKIFDYALRNKSIPLDWALDKEGKPTKDPSKASIFLPVGAHKGYGISVIIEVLASLLSGGVFGKDHGDQYGDLKNPNKVNIFFEAINIAAFRPLEEFKKSVDDFIDYLHSSPTAEGVKQVIYPGEIEAHHREKALKDGIELNENLIAELEDIASKIGLDDDSVLFLRKKEC